MCVILIVIMCALNMLQNSSNLGGLWQSSDDAIPEVEVGVPIIQKQQDDNVFVAKRRIPTEQFPPRGSRLSNHLDNSVYRDHAFHPYGKEFQNAKLDPSDPIFQRIGWDVDPIAVESHKLLFFTVPKNGCTEWKRLFRRMMNFSDWATVDPHNPATNGLRYLGHYNATQQIEFMSSPDWTRAIFVRDPLQRLLSAFLDKAHRKQPYIQQHCCNMANVRSRNMQNKIFRDQCLALSRLSRDDTAPDFQTFPFANFVNGFLFQCDDPHWRPQAKRMLSRNWEKINFVGHFETLEQDARRLLEHLQAWDDYGSTGWGKNGNFGFFERNDAAHLTSAGTQQEELYTPEILKTVHRYLQPDFDHKLFNFSRPLQV